ncbi:MAG: DUF190 domain-containing protein [Phycisphaeraceae bacterium]|nr:DUF190 domain-containing protein [Phycisphaeraceae bacterium]
MKIQGPGARLTIFIGESDQADGGPLYHKIVEKARASGLAGTTVLRGVEGFGAHSRLHTSRLLTLSEDLPVVIIIVDRADRIDRFARDLDGMVTEGLVVREAVDIVFYRGGDSADDRGSGSASRS